MTKVHIYLITCTYQDVISYEMQAEQKYLRLKKSSKMPCWEGICRLLSIKMITISK
jgi:hypothetical protein